MIISLKIFLALISISFGYVSYFVIKEYKKFTTSKESESGSLIDKFMIGTIAFSCVSLMVLLSAFCVLLICSSLSIVLPF